MLHRRPHTIAMAMLARRGAVSTTSAGCNRTVVRAAVARPSAPVRRSLAPVAAVKMPAGVPTPRRVPTTPEARFGFVAWAEKINGRAAMLG